MAEIPLPVEYRADVIPQIVRWAQAGESCSVVGIAGSGKGNIARHLCRADVRLRYFGAAVPQTFVLYAYCKPIPPTSPYLLFLDVLDALEAAAGELAGAFAPLQPAINALHREAQSNPELLAKRNLGKALTSVMNAGAQRVILLLDDCDDLFAKASATLFADLRALRDNHKYRLVYVTLTRRELGYLRDDLGAEEELSDLIDAAEHVIAVPAHSEADCRAMLQRLDTRQNPAQPLTETEIRQLYELAGGHASLMRALYFASRVKFPVQSRDAFNLLAHEPGVRDECEKIWNGLTTDERQALCRIVRHEPADENTVAWLAQVGVLRVRPTLAPNFCSPVFEKLVQEIAGGPVVPVLDFTPPPSHVRVNGEMVTTLRMPEYEILKHLWNKQPEVCTQNSLILALHEGERKEPTAKSAGNPLERLDRYIHEIKSKIGPTGQSIQAANNGYRWVP
ncbi:MAG: hypothetical protein HY782_05655 [Chloroflexi bacterium]|nr:hypothetical protein [Chloroflexota bacterium]